MKTVDVIKDSMPEREFSAKDGYETDYLIIIEYNDKNGNQKKMLVIARCYENNENRLKNSLNVQENYISPYEIGHAQLTGSYNSDDEALQAVIQLVQNKDISITGTNEIRENLKKKGFSFQLDEAGEIDLKVIPWDSQVTILDSYNVNEIKKGNTGGTDFAVACQGLKTSYQPKLLDGPYGAYYLIDVERKYGNGDDETNPGFFWDYSRYRAEYNRTDPTQTDIGLRLYVNFKNAEQFFEAFPETEAQCKQGETRAIRVSYGYLPNEICDDETAKLLSALDLPKVEGMEVPTIRNSRGEIIKTPIYQLDDDYYIQSKINLGEENFYKGKPYQNGKSVWIKVSPVEWIAEVPADHRDGVKMYTTNIVLAGTPYHETSPAPEKFEETTLYQFLQSVSEFLSKSNIELKRINLSQQLASLRRKFEYLSTQCQQLSQSAGSPGAPR